MVKNDNREFVRNLKKACDASPMVPPFGKGQQTWIAHRLGVSQEGVRRWFEGQSRPRTKLMKQLAKLLEVDEGWLAYNRQPGMAEKEEKVHHDRANSAVYHVFAILHELDYSCVYGQPTDDYDIMAVRSGKLHKISVTSAIQTTKHGFTFPVALNYRECVNIVVVNLAVDERVALYLEHEAIDKVASRKGVRLEIKAKEKEGVYRSSGVEWRRIRDYPEFEPLKRYIVSGVVELTREEINTQRLIDQQKIDDETDDPPIDYLSP